MSGYKRPTVALVGNPNSGKSTIFNVLTGLTQKTGNFAGVTMERKSGLCKLPSGTEIDLIDLPGTYSVYPKSADERIVFDIFTNPKSNDYPQLILVVTDASNIRRNLLLFSQLYDLEIPTILILNMIDVAEKHHIFIDEKKMSQQLSGIPVVKMNARNEIGTEALLNVIALQLEQPNQNRIPIYPIQERNKALISQIRNLCALQTDYAAVLVANHSNHTAWLEPDKASYIRQLQLDNGYDILKEQSHETISRYERIAKIAEKCVYDASRNEHHRFTIRADKYLVHPFWGYGILVFSLLLMFQAIFAWAQYPMDVIDAGIQTLNAAIINAFGKSLWISIITDGLIAGLGGVLIFVPQIAILFFFISILEETGYMARIMFLMDQMLRFFGLNGKSIVSLLSGAACAIPAIMAARNISNRKERLLTIFITPLISCSARIPVYTIVIALCIPATYVAGIISLQGLALMLLYALGFVVALISALIIRPFIKSEEKSFFVLEMPDLKPPKWKNVSLSVIDKVKSFVWGAGKIIVSISIILWFLSNFSWPGNIDAAEQKIRMQPGYTENNDQYNDQIMAARLEASFAGSFGKWIEPAIRPLGFDWKIGIALLTSFAAREVFVGTISTIYSMGSTNDADTLRARLSRQKDVLTGKPFFTFARGMSILLFYAFALQCMSTVATVANETKSWTLAIIQFCYLLGLAYLASLATFQLLP